MVHFPCGLDSGKHCTKEWWMHFDRNNVCFRVTFCNVANYVVLQVTLTAETKCRYITWRRKKLYLLFAKHRFISRLFSVLIRGDIADKLYALNEKVFVDSGFRFDIRLPNYYHRALPQQSITTTPTIRVQDFSTRRKAAKRP